MKHNCIWKFPLNVLDEQTIYAPNGSTPLAVAEKRGQLCLWMRVDTTARHVGYAIKIVGTGNPTSLTKADLHVGTVQQNGYVWHVFIQQLPN